MDILCIEEWFGMGKDIEFNKWIQSGKHKFIRDVANQKIKIDRSTNIAGYRSKKLYWRTPVPSGNTYSTIIYRESEINF